MESEIEVLNVVRVPPMGKLMVRVGKEKYQHISQVKDPEIRQRLMTAIGELVVFADGYEALEAEGVAPPLSTEIREKKPIVSQSLEERQAEFLTSLQQEASELYASDTEHSASEYAVGAIESDRTGDTGPLSIVGQINPILRKHVAADENLQGRKIELDQDAKGGLIIQVDERYFKRPDEIEDPDVRRVLRAALKEWDST